MVRNVYLNTVDASILIFNIDITVVPVRRVYINKMDILIFFEVMCINLHVIYSSS